MHIENLDVALQTLRFMEFSLEGIQQTMLFDPTDRCVVNLCAPQPHAVHKLLMIGERAGVFKAKVSNDLAQAGTGGEKAQERGGTRARAGAHHWPEQTRTHHLTSLKKSPDTEVSGLA